MEAAVANFAEPGRKFALLTNGFFGDRIGEMARRQGAEVVRLAKEWGQPYDPQEAREFIRRERPSMVAFVQAESPPGMFNQAKPICEAAHEVDALVIADCVTSLGAMPVMVDENGIDIAYSCTQKGRAAPGAGAITRFAARARAAEGADVAGAVVVPRSAIAGQLLTGQKYHHTASATHVLCAARRVWRWFTKRASRVAGSGTSENHIGHSCAGIEAMGLSDARGRSGRPPVDPEHAARAGGHRRSEGAAVLAGTARHRDRGRLRSARREKCSASD